MTFTFIWSIKQVMIYILSLIVIVLDQLTKGLMLVYIPQGTSVTVCPFFNLVSVRNRGISFSMFSGNSTLMPWILTAVALAFCIGIVVWLGREKDRRVRVGLALILGGAIGNIIDRVRLGAVVDFLDFYIGEYHWPAFNIADSAICIGVVLILILTLWGNKKCEKS